MAITKWRTPDVMAITKWSISGLGAARQTACQQRAMTTARNSQVFLRPRLLNRHQPQALWRFERPERRIAQANLGRWWPSRLVATVGRRSPEHLAMAGRNLWLLGIWLKQNVLKKVPFHDRYK